MRPPPRSSTRAFTLIELLVVIARVSQIPSFAGPQGATFGTPPDLDEVFNMLEQ